MYATKISIHSYCLAWLVTHVFLRADGAPWVWNQSSAEDPLLTMYVVVEFVLCMFWSEVEQYLNDPLFVVA